MARLTKRIFIGILVIVFAYLAYHSVTFSMNELPVHELPHEGFSGIKYARDCTCNPGFLPMLCGDPVNSANERTCVKGNYFCQQTTSPYEINACMTNT